MADKKNDKKPATRVTQKQKAWAINYIKNGFNATQAAKDAGYKAKDDTVFAVIGSENIRNPNIRAYMKDALGWEEAKDIADATEIMRFYTRVMRGQEKDAFGLDTGMGDRIKAANALERVVNMPGKRGDGVSATGGGFQLTIQPVYGAPPADDDEAEEGDGE